MSVCLSHHGVHPDGAEDHPTCSQEGNPAGTEASPIAVDGETDHRQCVMHSQIILNATSVFIKRKYIVKRF